MTSTLVPPTPADWQSFDRLQTAIDAFQDPFFVKDRRHRWVAFNRAFCELMGRSAEAIHGRSDPDFFPPEQVEVFWRGDDEIFASGVPFENEELFTRPDGTARTIWTRKYPIRDTSGQVIGLCASITDITEIKRREAEVEQLENEVKEQMTIIEAQRTMLDELSVPVIQVWDGILLLPLIGAIESRRAARIMESLLESIGHASAQIMIIDITGVPVVDTSVASHLVRSVQAAQLLGCESILVGISPEIAQTLVGLGVDFSRMTTRATLQNGLEYGLKRLSYDIKRN
jgi:rsbT co-antagonist protein RsbR